MEISFRELRIEGRADEKTRTVDAVLSSTEPVGRAWGLEILSHAHDAIDLSRATPSLPLLVNHNPDQIIGSAENVRLDGDKLRARLRFAKTPKAEEIFSLVRDGHLSGVSIGYMVDASERTGERGGEAIFTATRWRLLEATITPIPADHSGSGIGRSLKTNNRRTNMSQATSVENVDALSAAKNLAEIGEQYAKHGGRELASEAIRTGKDEKWLSAALVARMASNPSPASPSDDPISGLGLSRNETNRYSVLRGVRALVALRGEGDRRWISEGGLEIEASRTIADRLGRSASGLLVPYEVQKRDLTAGTANAGGYLVATDNLSGSFIDLLRGKIMVKQLGATVLAGLRGNVTIPKLTAAATGYWLASEATDITESQQTLGQLALSPKTVGAYTEISRLLLIQSDPTADMMVMNDLSKVVALAVDLAALNGSGASGQPLGVIGTSGIGAVAGASLNYAGLVEFETDVSTANADVASMAYLTTPAVRGILKSRDKTGTTVGNYCWGGTAGDNKVNGYRAEVTTQMPAANMLFGDFSQIVIGEWGVLEVQLNPYANFKAGIIGVRAMWSIDVGVRQAGAFSLATGIS